MERKAQNESEEAIRVREVPLNIAIPDDGIGMVIMQSFVELTHDSPPHWQNNKKNKQFNRIKRTLEIAMEADHGCQKTHFTIFPEYSIPGIEGATIIEKILSEDNWRDGTVVIGGIDGLTKEDYSILCTSSETRVEDMNKPERVRNDQWVNCCITWTKETGGDLKRWIQPKLVPAGDEELCPASHMFEGRAVYVFKTKIVIQRSEIPFRFASFICRDWVGNIGGSWAVDVVLGELEKLKRDDRLDLSLVFVLKRNEKPNHGLFHQRTTKYINEESHFGIRRSEGAVLFVNNAGKDCPGKCDSFGNSGFVFHPNSSFVTHKTYCPPTYTLKRREGLIACKEARFRENGSCILSIKFLPPISPIVRKNPSARRIPMNPAIVHSIDAEVNESVADPRTPGTEVPASVKWVNDELESINFILKERSRIPLRSVIGRAYTNISNDIRNNDDDFLKEYIVLSSYYKSDEGDKWIIANGGVAPNVDNWDNKEQQGLETVVNILAILGTCKPLKVKGSPAHATIESESGVLDIIIVSNGSHEECLEYAKNKRQPRGSGSVFVVTRDKDGFPWNEKFEKIYQIKKLNDRKRSDITDPNRFFHFSYQAILDCLASRDMNELNSELTRILGV